MVKPRKFKTLKTFTAIGVATIAVGMGGILLGVRGCNNAWNNKEIERLSSYTVSYATGLSGHTEYTKYQDGSQDLKIYPGLGHRLWDSEFHEDLDGDNKIDRIRRHGSELKMNSLRELLIRSQDYDTNKEKFDEADANLQKIIEKYPLR